MEIDKRKLKNKDRGEIMRFLYAVEPKQFIAKVKSAYDIDLRESEKRDDFFRSLSEGEYEAIEVDEFAKSIKTSPRRVAKRKVNVS